MPVADGQIGTCDLNAVHIQRRIIKARLQRQRHLPEIALHLQQDIGILSDNDLYVAGRFSSRASKKAFHPVDKKFPAPAAFHAVRSGTQDRVCERKPPDPAKTDFPSYVLIPLLCTGAALPFPAPSFYPAPGAAFRGCAAGRYPYFSRLCRAPLRSPGSPCRSGADP